MTGTLLFAGNQMQDFTTASGTGLSEITTSGHFDSSWVPNAVHTTNGLAMFAALNTAADEIWCHAWVWNNSADFNEGNNTFQWLNSSGTPILRLLSTTNNGTYFIQWWNGTAWVSLANPSIPGISGLHQWDFYIKINTVSGKFQFYLDQVLIQDLSFDAHTISSIKQWGIMPVRDTCDVSECIIHTNSTINKRYNLRLPSANGANTGFTGSYTDVDEPITDNSNFIYTSVANNISTFPTAGRTLTGYTVDAVIVTHLSMRDDASGPQNIQRALYIGGTNYFGPTTALALGWTSYREYLTTDPSTSAAWTAAAAGAGALEAGAKAIT